MEEEMYRTLRDEIAIAAMACMMQLDKYLPEQTATMAYRFADAMLEARKSSSTASQTRT